MKVVSAVLFIISLSTVSLAQTDSQPEPAKAVAQQQVTELPLVRRSVRPKLSLQRALKLAENYIEKEKIDISPYYLYEAKYILYGSKRKQPCWFFWWANERGVIGDYVEIMVSIDTGHARRLPSM